MRLPFLRSPQPIGLLVFLLFARPASLPSAEHPQPQAAETYPVSIHVIADSLNTLQATVQVPRGTNARDLMQQLFNMQFVDRGKKFVKGIAGFVANGRKKEYWALELDGEYAKVGIAEIRIDRPMRIVWRKRTY